MERAAWQVHSRGEGAVVGRMHGTNCNIYKRTQYFTQCHEMVGNYKFENIVRTYSIVVFLILSNIIIIQLQANFVHTLTQMSLLRQLSVSIAANTVLPYVIAHNVFQIQQVGLLA